MVNKLRTALLLCMLVALGACDKFTDIHKDFIRNGEIIYAVKPDSVAFMAGDHRLKMKLWMENAHNLKQVIVKWNNGADSLIIPAAFKTGIDSVEVMLNGLEEKSYSFNIYAVDNFGNKSLTYTQFGTVFGDQYEATLVNRKVKKVTLTEQNGLIEWFAPSEGMFLNEIKYTTVNGNDSVVRISAKQFSNELNAKAGTTFQYRSLYLPEQEAIDSFYTAWASDKFPDTYLISRTGWTAVSVSDEKESDGGGKKSLIDDNLGTFWHSQWGPDLPLPHWAIIDMGTAKTTAYFDVYRRSGNTDAKTVQIFLGNSSDPATGWTLAGEGVFASGDLLKVTNTTGATGRYLKIYLPDSNRAPFTSIAEIYAYGK